MKNGGKHSVHHQSVNPEGGAARVKSAIPRGSPVSRPPAGKPPSANANIKGNVSGKRP